MMDVMKQGGFCYEADNKKSCGVFCGDGADGFRTFTE